MKDGLKNYKGRTTKRNLKPFKIVAGVLLSFCLLYVGLSFKSTADAVERLRIEKEISSLSSKLSDLQSTYLSMKNKVTIELAYAKGFENVSNTTYAERKPSAKLSVNNEI